MDGWKFCLCEKNEPSALLKKRNWRKLHLFLNHGLMADEVINGIAIR